MLFADGVWTTFDLASGSVVRSVPTPVLPPPAKVGLPAPIDVDGDGKLEYGVVVDGHWSVFDADGVLIGAVAIGDETDAWPLSRRLLP